MGEISFAKKEGIDKNYLSIKDKKQPVFERDTDKPEAGIIPEKDGTMVYAQEQKKAVGEKDPYDDCINKKVTK